MDLSSEKENSPRTRLDLDSEAGVERDREETEVAEEGSSRRSSGDCGMVMWVGEFVVGVSGDAALLDEARETPFGGLYMVCDEPIMHQGGEGRATRGLGR